MLEMKVYRASQAEVRDALDKYIKLRGERSRFLQIAEDEYALRSWTED
jgi:hypothetical protein